MGLDSLDIQYILDVDTAGPERVKLAHGNLINHLIKGPWICCSVSEINTKYLTKIRL